MISARPRLALSAMALAGLCACAGTPVSRHALIEAPHYWQRESASSAIYMRGPKAQQMLNRDIAHCVTELRELQRLGEIRGALPGNTGPGGAVPDPDTPAGALAQYDTPARDGYLYAEFQNYHDFETCMLAKGWERIEHVPYDVARESRDAYVEAITGQRARSKTGETESAPAPATGDWGNLNN